MFKRINNWWQSRQNRFYRRHHWQLSIEIVLITLILLLTAIVLLLYTYNPVIDGGDYLMHRAATSTSTSTAIDKTNLDFEAGAELVSDSISVGDKAEWRLHFKNTGDTAIEQADLSVDLTSAAFNLKDINVEGEGVAVIDNSVRLQDIQAGENREFKIIAGWKAAKTDYPRTLSADLAIVVSAGMNRSQKVISLPPAKINSVLSVAVGAYYHSPQGDQLGIGPIPPVAGTPTTYWLIFKADNAGNDLKNFVVTARLPRGVELSGNESLVAGSYSYDSESRRLIWRVGEIKAVGGDYIANFGLTLTPSSGQVGQKALLLENIQYSADDVWTGSLLSGKINNIDTSLPDDRFNNGQGKVLAE